MRRSAIASVLVLMFAVLGCKPAASAPLSTATPGGAAAPTAGASTTVTALQILAALPSAQDVQQIGGGTQPWIAHFPEFYAPPFNLDVDPAFKGDTYWVHQEYETVGTSAAGVDIFVHAYPDAAAAAGAFTRMQAEDVALPDKAGKGPAVGSQSRYSTRVDKDYAPLSNISSVLAVDGTVTVRLQMESSLGFITEDSVAKLATPLMQRLRDAAAGRVSVSAAPELTSLFAQTLDGLTPLIGFGAAPEAWGADTSTTPQDAQKIGASWRRDGTSQVFRQRYALAADHDNLVDLTLIQAKDPAAARAALDEYRTQVSGGGTAYRALGTGAVPNSPVFASHHDLYELQFIAGRYFADVTCSSPFQKTAIACEAAVRKAAETWSAQLAKGS